MSYSFFAEEEQLRRLSELGDSLEKLKCIDFERFRPYLNAALSHECRSNAGRRSFDCVMIFRLIIRKFEQAFQNQNLEHHYAVKRPAARITPALMR